MTDEPLPKDESRAPQIIDRYAIYGEIASGGMATVHFARLLGPAGFAKTVVVKRLLPHLSNDRDFALMLIDEARLAARIRHPKAVATLDVIKTDTELLLVMEYVHGESLSKLARKLDELGERIPINIAAAVICDALYGLEAAHEATADDGTPLNLVHRDVSPQNILVGVDGMARIADFGIAKAFGRSQVTRDRSVKGKLAYMAPEQIRIEPVSRRTDVFAASIVFWELLTGQHLFDGENDAQIIHKLLTLEIPAPSSIEPSVPKSLDAILKRGLAREPADRFASAREMAQAIEQAVHAVRPSEVGAWVERVARESLASRTRAIAAAERNEMLDLELKTAQKRAEPAFGTDKFINLMTASTAEPHANSNSAKNGDGIDTNKSVAWARESSLRSEEREGTRAVKRAFDAPATQTLPKRRWPVVVAAIAILGGTAVGVYAIRPPYETKPSAQPSGDAQTVTTGVNSGTPIAPSADASAEQTAAVDAGASEASTPVGSLEKEPAESRPKKVLKRSGTQTTKANVDCDPPYSIDKSGRQIFKMECL